MTTDLASEAEKRARVPGIHFADAPAGRRAQIDGTGLAVFEVIQAWRELAPDRAAVLAWFAPMTEAQLQAALDYYALYPADVETFLIDDLEAEIERYWKEHPWSRPPWR